jgi:hypothetical protein
MIGAESITIGAVIFTIRVGSIMIGAVSILLEAASIMIGAAIQYYDGR